MWNGNKKMGKLHRDQRGTSMVTVIVSFALLLLCLTAFYRVQKVTGSMVMNSRDMIINNSDLIRAFYTGDTTQTKVSDEQLTFEGEDGDFVMEVTLMKSRKEGLNGSIYYFEEE